MSHVKRLSLEGYIAKHQASDIPVKKPRAKRKKSNKKHPETIIHEAIAGLFRSIIGRAGEANGDGVYWVSHENKPRSAAAGIANQRRGVKAGFPDLQILYDARSYTGEIKDPVNGRLEESQEAMHPHIKRAGVPVHIWFSPEDALRSLAEWKIPHRKAVIG